MNLFDTVRFDKNREIADQLFRSPILRVERIASSGQTTEFMEQDEDELVLLVRGEAILEDEDERLLELKEGELLYLPAGYRHRVAKTSDECIWLCFFFPPQEGARFFSMN